MHASLDRRRRKHALAVAALACAAMLPATGGVPLVDPDGAVYRWDLDAAVPGTNVPERDVVTFFVGPGPAELVNYVTPVRDAVRSWEFPTSRIRFREEATRPGSARNGLDRVNWIGWVTSGLSPFTFAATFPTRDGSRVLDMDVLLNDRDFFWGRNAPGSIGTADAQSLVTHEWGHAIGLDHVPLRRSTMYFSAVTGQTSLRTPEADDVAAVGALYPNAAFASTTGTLRGHVAVAGTKDDRAAHVVAVAVATGEAAASTLTAPDGTWVLAGLPAGAYHVLVAPTIPLGTAMNTYWRTGLTSFLPAVLCETDTNPARARTIVIAPGTDVEVPSIAVAAATRPLEPNESAADAVPISIGDAVCARFDTGNDQDWYEFSAAAGERIEVNVLAWGLGSDADPAVRLEAPDGATKTVFDVSQDATTIAGEDRDARFEWQVTTAGTHRVRVAPDKPPTDSNTFYVLLVRHASRAPSPRLSTATATPPRIDAGGAAESEVVIHPRREDGSDIGPGAIVRAFSSAEATVDPMPAQDLGDGTYRVRVRAPSSPGRDPLSVTVEADVVTSTGTARVTTSVPGLVELTYVGPVEASKSSLVAAPRRVPLPSPGFVPSIEVAFVPRDAAGEALGPGREDDVALDVSPLRGATVGLLGDRDGNGTYSVTVTPAGEAGRSTITASFRGAVVSTAPIAFGFALGDVLDMAAADVAGFRAVPGLPKRAISALASAGAALDQGMAAVAVPTIAAKRTALSRARTAQAAVIKALSKAPDRLSDPGTARELGLAVREAAEEAIAVAIRNGEARRAEAAGALLAKGDAAFGANIVTATRRWFDAWRRAM